MQERLKIQTLGGLTVQHGNEPIKFETQKEAVLLVYLACTGRTHPREVLAEMLWEERTQSRALGNLRHVLGQLRKRVDPYVTITRQSVAMNDGSEWWLDVTEFENQLDAARGQDVDTLETALDLYQGDFLAGSYLDSVAFEDWALRERERLRWHAMEALDTLVVYHLTRGAYTQGIVYVNQLLGMDTLREETHRHLMELLARSGQRAKALEQYATLRSILADEIGVEPSPETTVLYERIRAGELDEVERHAHRDEVIRLPQAPSESRVTTKPANNLPQQATSFVGREAEIANVLDQFVDPDCRLLTIVGTGGIGKTRLALQAAEQAVWSFPDGAWFVPLAPIRDPALVADTIARTLGVTEQAHRPITDTLKDHLSDKTLLLVLDNFEQLVEAAPLLPELIASAPGITILVTSREVLNVRGEQLYDAPPLDIPDPEATPESLSANEAVELFVRRARAVQHDFALTESNAPTIAAICARLEGLPLAIELAAARVRMFAPEPLLDRLDDRLRVLRGGPRDAPPRQQTLRATIDWSYHLLDEDERALFMRLGVFVGGWTVEAAEALCEDDCALDAVDGLDSLLNKSLVGRVEGFRGEPRFEMLETIREYALERLEASGEADEIRRRHGEHFLALLEQKQAVAVASTGWDDDWYDTMDWVESEHDNVRAMLGWAFEHGDTARVLRQLQAQIGLLSVFCSERSHVAEGRQWVERSLEYGQDAVSEVRVRVLLSLGVYADNQGDSEHALQAFQHALDLARRLENGPLIANVGVFMARGVMTLTGDFDQVLALLNEALSLVRKLDPDDFSAYGSKKGFMAMILHNMGEAARGKGDYEQARTCYEESIAIYRSYMETVPYILEGSLGMLDLREGAVESADGRIRNFLAEAAATDIKVYISMGLVGVAGVTGVAGQPERAMRLFGAADALLDSIGTVRDRVDQGDYDHYLALTRKQLDPDGFDALYAEGRAMSLEDAVAYALVDEAHSLED